MSARFIHDARGATTIEYALITGLIFLVIVSAVGLLNGSVTALFATIADAFS
jgi:pilus assembly protein Flp/PilA